MICNPIPFSAAALALFWPLFLFKHFLADFPLQTPYMLGKCKRGFRWVLPLATHCLVHAVLTSLILFFYTDHWLSFALMEFVLHFVIDRVKASPDLGGRFKDLSKPPFWICLGADQLAHGLTYAWFFFCLLRLY